MTSLTGAVFLMFGFRTAQVVHNASLYLTAVSIVINLWRDNESDPEVDDDVENTDYNSESSAKKLADSERREKSRDKNIR
jgi:hypothetical protein